MATSRSRQSDTTHQPSVRPADRYFQHEMTHQLYRGGGEGERHAEKVLCEREREGEGETRLYLFAESSLKRAGQQRKRGVRTERREELHVPRSKELDSAVHLSVSVSQRRSIPGHPVFTSAIRGYQTSAGL